MEFSVHCSFDPPLRAPSTFCVSPGNRRDSQITAGWLIRPSLPRHYEPEQLKAAFPLVPSSRCCLGCQRGRPCTNPNPNLTTPSTPLGPQCPLGHACQLPFHRGLHPDPVSPAPPPSLRPWSHNPSEARGGRASFTHVYLPSNSGYSVSSLPSYKYRLMVPKHSPMAIQKGRQRRREGAWRESQTGSLAPASQFSTGQQLVM